MAKPGKITAMISSTAADLPEHRKEAIDACLRASVFPIGMEHLPARDATGIQASLEMVDRADIYIGIYAWRYGWVPDLPDVPNPDHISITEMEFNRALERRQGGELKDILIFVMHDDHPIRARDKEDGAEAQEKLRKFKDRASTDRVRLTFSSAEELRRLVVQSLGESVRRIEAAEARLLLAYARMDAARMPDDDLDERTANRTASAHGLPESAKKTFLEKHHSIPNAPTCGNHSPTSTITNASRRLRIGTFSPSLVLSAA